MRLPEQEEAAAAGRWKVRHASYRTRSDDLSCGPACELPGGAPSFRRQGRSGNLHAPGTASDCEMVRGASAFARRQMAVRISDEGQGYL